VSATTDMTSVRRSTIVDAPIEHAFKVFTEDMGAWWDPSHHLVSDFKEMVVELRAGGRIVDHAHDGSTCSWSRVLAYEPPERFVFSWDINLAWEVETDPARASEIEVRFFPEGPDRTRVELEHKHLDRHGDGWEAMRDAVGSPNGWDLAPYARVAGSTR
jgi:uncharacterized protein YndB with AHSA1/START domain